MPNTIIAIISRFPSIEFTPGTLMTTPLDTPVDAPGSLHSDLSADEHEHVGQAGLGVRCTTMELCMMDRHQHLPAVIPTMVLVLDATLFPPQQSSTKQLASELATSSSSNAAVGDKVARVTVEPTCTRSRHESKQRERRDQTAFAIARSVCLSVCLSVRLSVLSALPPPGDQGPTSNKRAKFY